MPNLKISELPDGGMVQGTDAIPVTRAGANARVGVGSAATAAVGDFDAAGAADAAVAAHAAAANPHPVYLTQAEGDGFYVKAGAGAAIAAGTATTDVQALGITQTWNNVVVAFTAAKLNVTNIASAAASLLLDLQVDSSSAFSVSKAGQAVFLTGAVGAPSMQFGNPGGGATGIYSPTTNQLGITANGIQKANFYGNVDFYGTVNIAPEPGSGDYSPLKSEGQNKLALGENGRASTFRIYNSLFTNSSNYERLAIGWTSDVLQIDAEYLGTGVQRNISLQSAGGNVGIGITTPTAAKLVIAAGTATTDVNALSITQTWNNAAVAFTGVKWTITETAAAAGALAFEIFGGAAGATSLLKLSKAGVLTVPGLASLHASTHQNGGPDEISVAGLSGVLADPQPPIIGAGGTQAVAGNDARLSDARTPTAHATSHTSGADKIATGTPDGTKFLRDDFSWQAPGGGAAWGGITGTLASQTDLQAALDAKQATLISGTNIKTINGSTVLGSGNLTVSAGDPSYSPGSFTVATETWKLLGNHLKLTTTQRATVAGTGRLRVSD